MSAESDEESQMRVETNHSASRQALIKSHKKLMKTGFDGARSLGSLNVRELYEVLDEYFGNRNAGNGATVLPSKAEPKRLVYGLRGIQGLFNCSHKTAQHYKDHVIKEAVNQNGRKIVVDADLALKLFKERGAK